ncbi:MAG: DUF420 domain-containing protein [Verrucomicrobiales bacterium]|nr:DUF420 domain-containing protein [Verrucomicrobiales bacterium]
MEISDFPPLNATLNGLSAVFLIAGFCFIKAGKKKQHIISMIGAVTFSAVFLICYVIYHTLKGDVHTTFPTEYPTARKIYYPMLISHILLAIVNLPMVIVTVVLAARQKFESHKKWARWTFPIWLYVSVTGVLVYFMLYQWFLPSA